MKSHEQSLLEQIGGAASGLCSIDAVIKKNNRLDAHPEPLMMNKLQEWPYLHDATGSVSGICCSVATT